MSGTFKKNLEKKIDVDSIINKILKINTLKLEEFLLKTDISLDSYRKAVASGRLTGPSVENILEVFDVNRGFLEGSEDLTTSGKLTSVQKGSDNKGNPLAEPSWEAVAFRKLIEGGSEYVLVSRAAFEGSHRFTSVEQVNAQAEQIKMLTRAFIDFVRESKGLGSIPDLPKVEETQKGTSV